MLYVSSSALLILIKHDSDFGNRPSAPTSAMFEMLIVPQICAGLTWSLTPVQWQMSAEMFRFIQTVNQVWGCFVGSSAVCTEGAVGFHMCSTCSKSIPDFWEVNRHGEECENTFLVTNSEQLKPCRVWIGSHKTDPPIYPKDINIRWIPAIKVLVKGRQISIAHLRGTIKRLLYCLGFKEFDLIFIIKSSGKRFLFFVAAVTLSCCAFVGLSSNVSFYLLKDTLTGLRLTHGRLSNVVTLRNVSERNKMEISSTGHS